MPIAQFDYPDGGIFLSILWIFLFVIWFWLLITIFTDLWRADMSGWAKALWVIFVIILPFLGILVYLIANGRGMQERAVKAQKDADAQFRDYVRSVSGDEGDGGAATKADALEKLAGLKERGVLSDEEFEQEKAKILG